MNRRQCIVIDCEFGRDILDARRSARHFWTAESGAIPSNPTVRSPVIPESNPSHLPREFETHELVEPETIVERTSVNVIKYIGIFYSEYRLILCHHNWGTVFAVYEGGWRRSSVCRISLRGSCVSTMSEFPPLAVSFAVLFQLHMFTAISRPDRVPVATA